jgi:hypothetical protein
MGIRELWYIIFQGVGPLEYSVAERRLLGQVKYAPRLCGCMTLLNILHFFYEGVAVWGFHGKNMFWGLGFHMQNVRNNNY